MTGVRSTPPAAHVSGQVSSSDVIAAAWTAISTSPFLEETPWVQRHPVALDDAREDPDRVALVLFTSGTSGEPKGALNIQNTMYASAISVGEVHDFGRDDMRFPPHPLMHVAAQDNALAVFGRRVHRPARRLVGRAGRVGAGRQRHHRVCGRAELRLIAATGGTPPHPPVWVPRTRSRHATQVFLCEATEPVSS